MGQRGPSDAHQSPPAGGVAKCHACGQEVEKPVGFCPFCGAAFGPVDVVGPHPSDPYLLLMTANVLRLRRQWSLAEAKCSELLKLVPENAAAHSLMGDILRDQGRDQDAIEWYKLAVDHDPGNETDRKKLEALIDRRFAEKGQSCVRRVTRSLLDRWRKAPREEAPAHRPACPWAMVTAGVFAIVLLSAFGLVLVGRRISPPRLETEAGPPVAPRTGTVEALRPVVVPTAETGDLRGDIAALEQSTFERARQKAQQTDMNARVYQVQIDPKHTSIQVEVSVPAYWSPEETRKGLLKVAGALAPLLAQADARLTSVQVRGLTRQPNGTEQVAMVAEGATKGFRETGTVAPGEGPEKLFESIWWEGALRTEREGGTGGSAQSAAGGR